MARVFIDDTGQEQAVEIVSHPTAEIGHGVKNVATAGTPLPLVAVSTPALWVIIQAQTDNAGIVAIGGADVDATVSTGTGIALTAGQSIQIPCSDLALLFVDALTNNDGVRFLYGN